MGRVTEHNLLIGENRKSRKSLLTLLLHVEKKGLERSFRLLLPLASWKSFCYDKKELRAGVKS